MTTSFSGPARGILGISTILIPGWFGFSYANPWIIAILGITIIPLYMAGKWQQWMHAWQEGGAPAIGKGILITVPIQTLFVGLIYLIGLGIGALTTTYTCLLYTSDAADDW